jgi:hypothetical protein
MRDFMAGHKTIRLVLLVLYGFLPLWFQTQKSATFDEPVHIVAGYSYLKFNRVILNPQHPPFLKELCAVPLMFMNLQFPATVQTLSEKGDNPYYQWTISSSFLYGNDKDRILFWSRIPTILLSMGLAIIVMAWAQELWGMRAGTLALFLCLVEPTITAHSQFVTTDVGAAFFSTLYLFVLWRFASYPKLWRLLVCGLVLGLALGSKFSLVILLPVSLILLAVRTLSTSGLKEWTALSSVQLSKVGLLKISRHPWAWKMVAVLFDFVLICAVSAVVLWAIYLFPVDPFFYWKGLSRIYEDKTPGYPFFLMGKFDPLGWWYYLPVAWLVKTPIPFLLFFGSALLLLKIELRKFWLSHLWLFLPWLSLFGGYSLLSANIGVRYLMPCIPLAILVSSRIGSLSIVNRRLGKIVLAIVLVWAGFEYYTIAPDHLSYFNQIAGGYRGGINWLDDSNVDWGQGLIQLRNYLEQHPQNSYTICAFGNFSLPEYGIQQKMVQILGFYVNPPQGAMVLSAHHLARLKAAMNFKMGNSVQNWTLYKEPLAIVGHCFYIYDFQ